MGSLFWIWPLPSTPTWPFAEGHALKVDRGMQERICSEQREITRFSFVSSLQPEETTSPSVSAYGLRAVISRVMESKEEKPLIAFASWTLTASDCNYSQIEKRCCPLCSWWRSFIHTFMASSLCHYFWSKDRGASIGSSQIAKIGPWF